MAPVNIRSHNQAPVNIQKQHEKKFGKSVLVVDKSTDHDKPYFDFYVFVFYDNIVVKENVYFQSAS